MGEPRDRPTYYETEARAQRRQDKSRREVRTNRDKLDAVKSI